MEVISYRLELEGGDLIERWIFERKIKDFLIGPKDHPYPNDVLNESMKKFFKDKVEAQHFEYPIVAALISAADNLPPSYAVFGDMLEVRFNDALKQVVIE